MIHESGRFLLREGSRIFWKSQRLSFLGTNCAFVRIARLAGAVVIAGFVAGLTVGHALAYSPAVSITNTTRGGSSVFYVGDAWAISITGGAPSAQVTICIPGSCSVEGNTDGSGDFSVSGYIYSTDVGTWNETWSVGGVPATPNPLTFYVYPTSSASCMISISGSGAIYSDDELDAFGDILYQALGYTYASAAPSPSGYCVMYSDAWSFGVSMAGQRTIQSAGLDQWEVWDNGNRPYYDGDYEAYYPYFDSSALGFVSIDITNGNLYYQTAIIGLVVDYSM